MVANESQMAANLTSNCQSTKVIDNRLNKNWSQAYIYYYDQISIYSKTSLQTQWQSFLEENHVMKI